MAATTTFEIQPPITSADVRRFGEERVNLSKDVADARRKKVGEVRERLKKWIAENLDSGLVKSFLSGSLAKGTALQHSSDVDVAIYLKHDGERKVDRELLEWLAARLRQAYPQMAAEQIVVQEYSVKITFKGAGFDIDVVPVFYEGDPDDKGWLASKRTGELLMTSIPMHLAFFRARKSKQPKHFAQWVRLLKWWAEDKKEANANFRFKSFMVELICAHLADKGLKVNDYPKAMEAFFNYIVSTGLKTAITFDDYEVPSTSGLPSNPIVIMDPVNPENNVADLYTEYQRQLIVEAAQDALDALNEAHTAETKKHALEMWRIVLGSSFKV